MRGLSEKIKGVRRGSPGYKRLKPGERLLAINGHAIRDVLDYMYFSYDSELVMDLMTEDGKYKKISVKKPEGMELGIEFESYLMDKVRACSNKCIFCFVDQLPAGMRDSLYFKDDDLRLSFLMGNYVTLTNLSRRQMQRILDLRVSPINISVHATDPKLRNFLLGGSGEDTCFARMNLLKEAGITMNCQIVCCPGINDGQALGRTMSDLESLYPQVHSVSVVPVGLTRHRDGLYPLRPFDPGEALLAVRQIEDFSKSCLARHGSRIFFASDELYLKAECPLPEDGFYEGYPQLENGVGMLRLLITEFEDALPGVNPLSPGPVSIATGTAAAPFLRKMLQTAEKKCGKIDTIVYPIVNHFFGESIDVAGLVTGGDLLSQLRGRRLGRRLILPQNMLRRGEDVFLDDVTLEEVEQTLGVPVCPVGDGRALALAVLRGDDNSIGAKGPLTCEADER